jgi:hypothetical protein
MLRLCSMTSQETLGISTKLHANMSPLKEVDKLAFLFGVQAGPDLDGLGRVFGVDLYRLSILGCFEGAE